jgi:tRNA modification GTPase
MVNCTDTIAAIATPPGEAGIAVIRVSGKSAFPLADKIFTGKKIPSRSPTHTVHYGKIKNPKNKEIIDTVLLSIYRAPKSYTGEDMIEISCHGGTLVADRIMKLLLANEARLAEPGEFTKRAVLLGKLDITQAEAILDLVQAKTDKARRSAISQLTGSLSNILDKLSGELKDILCQTEHAIEFDEDDRFNPIQKIKSRLKKLESEISRIIVKGETERFLREGALVVIVGKPNVGKSSIFNRLLERERAIVTEIPGTTRDILEERIVIAGTPIRLVDTAGLCKTRKKIEVLGVSKTNAYLNDADLILSIFDNSKPINSEDKRVMKDTENKNRLLIINKIDLKNRLDWKFFNGTGNKKIIRTSARYNQGIKELRKTLTKQFESTDRDAYFITNRRHIEALKRTKQTLAQAQKETYLELIAQEIRNANDALGEITGKTTNEDILNKIFAQFCIGK